MALENQKVVLLAMPKGSAIPLRFLETDDEADQFVDIDEDIIGPSESDSFISASENEILSSSDDEIDIYADLDILSIMNVSKNSRISNCSSNECKVFECTSSYSLENRCEAIDTDLPEPDPTYELTETETLSSTTTSDYEDFTDF